MRAFWAIVLAFVILTLSACGAMPVQDKQKEESQTTNQEADSTMVTKEYIIEHSELTEADFEGIDFDDFVSHYKLTPERLEKYDPVLLLALYKETMSREPTADYTVIYAAAEGTIRAEEFDDIAVLIWEYHSGNYNSCMVIDKKAGAVYYGLGNFLAECGESRRVSDFREEDSVFLKELLTESGISEWKTEYEGTSEGTTGSYSWAVGIKLNDDRCFCYSGYGVLNSGTPETLEPMLDAMIEHFKN